jgi:hypothetical protein
MALKGGTKAARHSSDGGPSPAPGPKGSPPPGMGKFPTVPDKTRGDNVRVHGGVAGGASPANNPKVRSNNLPGGKPLGKW